MDLFVLILIPSRGHHGMQYHLSINMGIKPEWFLLKKPNAATESPLGRAEELDSPKGCTVLTN